MLQTQPSLAEFRAVAGRVNAVPVYCTLLSDHLTPVSAFERLAGESRQAFLLESVVGGEKIARYSFLGHDPLAVVQAPGGPGAARRLPGDFAPIVADPLDQVQEILGRFRAAHSPELPRFLGGAVGYAGYDVSRRYDRIGEGPPDDRGLPEVLFGVYDRMVIFDHVRKVVHLVAHAHLTNDTDADLAYQVAQERLHDMAGRLRGGGEEPLRGFSIDSTVSREPPRSTFTRERFEQAVERCKQYIRAGDAFQIVLSQRLTATTRATPFDVYRALRVVAPSPFMFYLQTPSVCLVGSSPEVLCRIEGRTVSTRPLAGTRPRGRTETEDRGLEAELLADPKERAEHVMLVDLGRNDLARVCEPGSVRVDELMSVERFSHVMHICSNVSGTLADGKTAFDALRSVLPVGTVSGAPKVRAMQIIDELEPARRGPYGGAVGYIDFAGNMDTCIALRTLIMTPQGPAPPSGQGTHSMGGWRVDVQVGAGIVADSEPAREFQETLNKAEGLLAALRLADAWFDRGPPHRPAISEPRA
jgi:anthranilate synthase component 1